MATHDKDAGNRARFAVSRGGFLKGSLGIAAAGFLTACESKSLTAEADSGAGGVGGAGQFAGGAAYDKAISQQVAGRTVQIGFTPPALSEFYDEIEHGAWSQMREYENRFGIKWKWDRAAPADHSAVETQVSTIEDWATKKYTAILVCTAGDFASMQRVYDLAESRGSRIFQFNMPAELWPQEQIKATSTIGYNNTMQAGYLVGEYLAKQLNGQGKILQIWGLPGHWSTARNNGFKLAIARYPGMQIVGNQRGDYVRDKAFTAAQNLLQRSPDVNAIYGENEEMALGAAQAIDQAGLDHWDGKKGIITMGADGLKSGYEAIKAGRLTATVDVGPVDQGRLAIQTIFSSLMLGRAVDPVIDVPTGVIDKTNADVSLSYANWALAQPKY